MTTLAHIIGYQVDSRQADAPPAATAYARWHSLRARTRRYERLHRHALPTCGARLIWMS